ncbi:MAG: hypothetical protein Q4E27_00010 [Bacteroidales bacterium]|nr:hypothetical protein [Bacteroidales bacterium]
MEKMFHAADDPGDAFVIAVGAFADDKPMADHPEGIGQIFLEIRDNAAETTVISGQGIYLPNSTRRISRDRIADENVGLSGGRKQVSRRFYLPWREEFGTDLPERLVLRGISLDADLLLKPFVAKLQLSEPGLQLLDL